MKAFTCQDPLIQAAGVGKHSHFTRGVISTVFPQTDAGKSVLSHIWEVKIQKCSMNPISMLTLGTECAPCSEQCNISSIHHLQSECPG